MLIAFVVAYLLVTIAVGLWAFVALVVGTIFPAIYQGLRVNPNELQSEKPYIARNIRATRDAFGLSRVRVEPFDYQQNLDAAKIEANARKYPVAKSRGRSEKYTEL